jgi:hypothetical protein
MSTVTLQMTTDEALGSVSLTEGRYGPNIHIGGIEQPIGYVDLFYNSPGGVDYEGNPGGLISLMLFDPLAGLGEVLCKISINKDGRLTLIVNKDAIQVDSKNCCNTIHTDGDRVFMMPKDDRS